MVVFSVVIFVFVADYWTFDFSGHAVKSEEVSFQQSWSSVCGEPSVAIAIATTFMFTFHLLLWLSLFLSSIIFMNYCAI